MSTIKENQVRFSNVVSKVEELAREINEKLSDEVAFVTVSDAQSDAESDDTTSIVMLDIPSFMSFDTQELPIFRDALAFTDAVNFFIVSEEYLRITLVVLDTKEPDNNKYDTVVSEFKRRE